jgi:hypothetical protein
MADALLKFKASGKTLEDYVNDRSFVQIIMGPLGSGKTTATAFTVFERICQQKASSRGERRSRVAVVRNTFPDLTNTTIRDWRAIVPEGSGSFTMGHPPEHKLDFDLPDGTRVISEVIFIALDKPEHVKKLRGMQLTFAWVNEAKEVAMAVIAMLTGRVDRYPMQGYSTYVGILCDTNAWDSDHYLNDWYEKWKAGEMPDYRFFIQPGALIKVEGKWVINPDRENKEWVGDEYYLRQIAGKKEDWIKVNLGNQVGFAFDGKPVHGDYSDTYHVSQVLLTPVPGIVRVGMDFGLTPAALFWQRQSDGQWWAFDEIVCEDAAADEFSIELKARVSQWDAQVSDLRWIFTGDPAGDDRSQTDKQTVFQVLRLNGIPANPASSNDTELRRSAIDRPLTRTVAGGKPGLLVSPNCVVFRKGMAGGFCYKRVQIAGEERYRDVPDKNKFSHIVEAGEYGIMDGGEHAVRNPSTPKVQHARPQQAVQSRWNPFDI